MGVAEERARTQDIAWDYFKLLANQRVTHFNLFIVLVCAITAIQIANLHVDIKGNIVSGILSVFQMVICFIFYKIDLRNKFLYKHIEKTIKSIERTYQEESNQIFLQEGVSTQNLRDQENNKAIFTRQLSASQLYKFFYSVVFCMSIIELVISIVFVIQGFA